MKLIGAEELFDQAWKAKNCDQIDKAIELFSQIKKSSDELKRVYARAQFSLGLL